MAEQMKSRVLLLLAEDDQLMLSVTREALEDGGYEVLTASTGQEAMQLIETHAETAAGLITDIRMGKGPNGWDLAHRARSLKTDIAVVYTTGNSPQEWSVHGVPQSVLVQKPYAPAQVLTAISGLLVKSA